MKTKFVWLVLVFSCIIAACSSSKESTGVWVNKEKMQGKSYKKVFIVMLTADVEARSVLESDLADRAKSRGLQTVKSIDVLPPTLSSPKTPTKEEVIAKVKETACDAVFVASLLRKEEDVRYTPGTTAYSVMPYYSYYGTYTGFYSHYYPTVSTPSYYTKEKNYFMQSNLYDVATEEIMWSVQSEVFNPSSLKKFSKEYTSSLVKQLESQDIIKK